MQGEGGEKNMVVLFLAASAFDVFTGEKPRLPVEIDIFPFGLQQLANPAQGAHADPKRELVTFFKGRISSYVCPAGRAL